MTLRLRSLVALALVAGSVAACRKKPEPAPEPVVTPPTATVTTPPRVNQDSIDAAARAAAAAAERAAMASAIEAARVALTAPIFFDYDQSDLRDDARAILESKVPVLVANTGVRIRIAGHTDEAGSDEYNLALGQRRAAAARRYLESRGIAATRIDIVSFGEERPRSTAGTPEAFAQNRRDEFEIIAGGDQLRPAGR
jgi:peptidoglycan-associated lipoprotein